MAELDEQGPTPWQRLRPNEGGADDQRAARLLRAGGDPGITPRRLDAMWARTRQRLVTPVQRPRRIAWGLLVTLLLGGASVSAVQLARRHDRVVAVAAAPAPPVAPASAPIELAPVELAPVAAEATRPRPAMRRAAPPRAPAVAPSALAEEAALLESAVAAVRAHAPQRALDLLDVHARRFASGVLARESAVVRVDALLALGRGEDARRTLTHLDLERAPRTSELRVLRGELAANAGDCAAALTDFDRVLAGAPEASLVERATIGRASCRAQLGDGDGARAELERYLARFPNGRFSARARHTLQRP